MWVLVCQECGYILADPNRKLSSFYNCAKCDGSTMRYREATAFENIKIKLHLIDQFK